MNLKKELWSQKDYHSYIEYLRSLQDEKYKLFHQSLVTTKYEILGIPVPIQRKIAKEISKGDYQSFLKFCEFNFYEEVIIEGFVIANIKEEEVFYPYFKSFLSKIDNWAICDSFCNSLKIIEKNHEKYFQEIKKLLYDSHEFTVRVGLVLLLSFYVKEEYVTTILDLISGIFREEYYIKMAMAWLIAECFILYPEKTWPFLKKNDLDVFTHNKAISKITDSYRVSREVKDELKKYRKSVKC